MRPSPVLTSRSPAPAITSSSSSIRLSTSTNQFATLAKPTATQAAGGLPASGSSAAPSANELHMSSTGTALALLPYVAEPPTMLPPSSSANDGELPIQIEPIPAQQSPPGPDGQDIEMREQ
jgi:hypothetical protein